jgi:LysR family transcriptional regulator, low CO2-responsive transcriptional regulator
MISNLTLLQTFYHLAHEGSYSAAARNLGLSYQSVANHVRRLEQMIGDKLVESEKGGKQVALTPRGHAMYKLLHPELDIMLKRLALLIDKERPVLRVGLPQAAFFYLFPGILRRMQREHEGIEIRALERDTVLPDLVKDGSLDVCISESFFGDPMVPQRLLGVYQLCLVVPRSWEIEPSEENISEQLKDRPFITYEPGQTLRNFAIDFLVQSGIEASVSVSTSGSSSVKRCVEEGLGFAIIPSWCIEADEPRLLSVVLENIPEIKMYFGHAQFLSNSVYVKSLYDACQENLSGKMLDIAH